MMSIIQRLRRQGGLKKLKKLRCSVCKAKYLAYRVFTDPETRRQFCFPSCLRNAQNVAVLNSIPDFTVEPWAKPYSTSPTWED